MRILVVDDYPGTADVSCVLLRLLGHEAFSARTASDAVKQFESVRPDIVILDLGLPDQSGFEVARMIRKVAGPNPPFIAAMTGFNNPDDRVRSLAAGIDLHVVKPASAENLTLIVDAANERFKTRDESGRA